MKGCRCLGVHPEAIPPVPHPSHKSLDVGKDLGHTALNQQMSARKSAQGLPVTLTELPALEILEASAPAEGWPLVTAGWGMLCCLDGFGFCALLCSNGEGL